MKRLFSTLISKGIYLLLPGIAGVFVFILIDLSGTVEHLSQSMVERSLDLTRLELDNFFRPIQKELSIEARRLEGERYDSENLAEFNHHFQPFIEKTNQVSSLLFASQSANEFMLLDMDSVWMNRVTTSDPGLSSIELFWNKEWPDSVQLIRDRKDPYDPRSRPWFIRAQEGEPLNYNWTEPYTFATTKDPGITISTRVRGEIEDLYLAFDLTLTSISEFTTNLKVTENGYVAVLTESGNVIGLPRDSIYKTTDHIRKDVLKSYQDLNKTSLIKGMNIWNNGLNTDTTFSFKEGNKTWWGGFNTYPLGINDRLILVVMVPEHDFVGEVIQSRNYIILGFILVILFTLYILKAYSDKKKSNHILSEQKEKIEQQKEEIMDSITYAKRIQGAILPPFSLMHSAFEDMFILYQPKDIVAGDFYWFEQTDNHILIAAADCTGHGVPGALVSVVCHNALNRAVREFDLRDPGKILDKVTDLVIETFEKSTEEVKDGMDISLAVLTHSIKSQGEERSVQLKWSGANNPIWILRHNSQEIEEIKADKQPIGKFDNAVSFTTHEVKLYPGDRFYLFSDGFADQFGGDKGKKLKNKSFKSLLLDIQQDPMQVQKDKLQTAFESWKGEFEQVDDVCVIGVRV